jgi:hypothetical protein
MISMGGGRDHHGGGLASPPRRVSSGYSGSSYSPPHSSPISTRGGSSAYPLPLPSPNSADPATLKVRNPSSLASSGQVP